MNNANSLPVFALHGDFANGRVLRRDTGIAGWNYPNWKTGWFEIGSPCVLVGYSRGGSEIGTMSTQPAGQRLIRAAVLYESPLLEVDSVAGDFPVLWIENGRGRRSNGGRFAREMQDTLEAWQAGGRDVTILVGEGRHAEPCLGFPPIRHGWDRALNTAILDWISRSAPPPAPPGPNEPQNSRTVGIK